MQLLVGDIGGTRSRFGMVGPGGGRPEGVEILANDDFPTFDDALAAYLDRSASKPKRAAFAVAGPIRDRTARLTNRNWSLDADALARRFHLEEAQIINDFVAQAASLPHLADDELRRIGATVPADRRTKAAVGPGTGLGVAGLVHAEGCWIPVASEGGHVELAASDDREAALIAAVRRELGRAEAESLLCGPGLGRLHRLIAGEDAVREPSEIVERAAAGDAPALDAIRLFLTMLARFAGDVALMFGARGGIYLCGGVAPKLLPFLDEAAFRSAFEAKPPHVNLMRATATVLVTSEIAGLIGSAAVAQSGRE